MELKQLQKITISELVRLRVHKATEIKKRTFLFAWTEAEINPQKVCNRVLALGKYSTRLLSQAEFRSIHTMGQSHSMGDWLQAEEYRITQRGWD